MIDFNKISKIKNKNDLKKFKIDEPIFLNNYLFHYLIMTNNIKGMKLQKFPIYKENNEGLQGLHLAAKVAKETKNYDMLNYLLEEYPEYANNHNYFNESFLDMLDINDNMLDLIKKHDKINWFRLFTNIIRTENSKQCFANKVFKNGKDKFINILLDIIAKNKFNWREFGCQPIFEIPLNSNLNTKQKIDIFEKLGIDLVFSLIDNYGRNIIYPIIESEDVKLLDYVIKKDIDLDKYTTIFTMHPFLDAYFKESGSKDQKYTMSKMIWNNIKETHNFESTNKYNENLAFLILNYRLISGLGDDSIEEDIIKRNHIWNKQSIEKENLIEIITNLNFDKYSKWMKKNNNIKFDDTLVTKSGEYVKFSFSAKWKKFISELPKVDQKECLEELDVDIGKYKLANSNTFSSTIFDAGLFFIHFTNKYKNLYIPKYIDNIDIDLNWDNGFDFPNKFLDKYNNFPWTIFWKDKYNYHIHPYLNMLINSNKNNNNYDGAVILLSVLLPHEGLHAMILFYDFKNNFIERFDPYGNTYDIDIDIDNILEEELTWNTGFSYVNVKKYLPVAGFQNLSDENNALNQKPGDFGGYCLAWCLWYLELRLNNYKYSAKQLVKKAISKILKTETSMMTFIRNYANDIDKFRLELLEETGINKERVSNNIFNDNEMYKLIEFIISKLTIKKI